MCLTQGNITAIQFQRRKCNCRCNAGCLALPKHSSFYVHVSRPLIPVSPFSFSTPSALPLHQHISTRPRILNPSFLNYFLLTLSAFYPLSYCQPLLARTANRYCLLLSLFSVCCAMLHVNMPGMYPRKLKLCSWVSCVIF